MLQVSGLGYSNELIEHAFGQGGSECSDTADSASEILFEPIKKDSDKENQKNGEACSSTTSGNVSPCSSKSDKNSESSSSTKKCHSSKDHFRKPKNINNINAEIPDVKSPVGFPPL